MIPTHVVWLRPTLRQRWADWRLRRRIRRAGGAAAYWRQLLEADSQ